MNGQVAVHTLVVVASAMAFAILTPLAGADAVYHTEHLDLTPVGSAPLRSGFVQNIKAEGPEVYAHEIFVLNGGLPSTTYTVARNFFFLDPECDGTIVFPSDIAALSTNAAGNNRADVFVTPEETAGFAGVHGVMWTLTSSVGAVAYRTECTAVTLD
jgi:hypothetical protein